MGSLRDPLLGLYRVLTRPARRRAVRAMAAAGRAPIAVLFYHRVADSCPNGWTMPTRMFRRQVEWLEKNCEVVSLGEARRRLINGESRRPAAVITFDDGYGDNCETALPLLLRRRLPFTYFVSTEIVEEQTAFPHDLEAGVRLRPNTVAELRSLAACGVDGVELGAHTRTHPDLGRIADESTLRDQVVGSIDQIEEWTSARPTSFAFPFGLPKNLSTAAVRLAHDVGVETVCSAYGAYNLPGEVTESGGVVHVRRVHGDPEWGRFANWMTFDPRKLRTPDPVDDRTFLAEGEPTGSGPAAAIVGEGADD